LDTFLKLNEGKDLSQFDMLINPGMGAKWEMILLVFLLLPSIKYKPMRYQLLWDLFPWPYKKIMWDR
jgi:hypothetical protein